jgi:predicted dehydrogenase
MRVIRAAIAGTGFIGPVHAEAIRRLGHSVIGILGSTPEKSQLAADALGLEKGYRSFDELLLDQNVEVVHIATPNRFHVEQCQTALAAGKHVVCEKPLGMTSIETGELVKLAKAHPKLVAAVNYNVRFYPLCLEARERVRSGEVGDVFHITGAYLQDWLLYPSDFNWRVLPEFGGDLRAIADIGTHWLDLLLFITGLEVEAVFADLRTVHPVRQQHVERRETFKNPVGDTTTPAISVSISTEDYGSVLVRFKSGARGCLSVSQVTAGRKNCIQFEIAGSKEALSWNSEKPETLRIGHRDRANEVLWRDPALLCPSARLHTNYPGGHVEGFPDTFKQLYKAVYDTISTGQANPLIPTFTDGHREALICEAIIKSQRSGTWQTVAQ